MSDQEFYDVYKHKNPLDMFLTQKYRKLVDALTKLEHMIETEKDGEKLNKLVNLALLGRRTLQAKVSNDIKALEECQKTKVKALYGKKPKD